MIFKSQFRLTFFTVTMDNRIIMFRYVVYMGKEGTQHIVVDEVKRRVHRWLLFQMTKSQF